MVDTTAREMQDDLLVFEDEPRAAPAPQAPAPAAHWRVLIVDDDETVHEVTRLALAGAAIEGRPLELMHAHSADQALAMAAAQPDLAVALVDVVMEEADAGLRLVRELREVLGRRALRLILRTGQPGYAPEMETVRDYDINDYWTKTELTRTRLFVCLTTALRAYRQYAEIERQRDELRELAHQLERARVSERESADRRLAAEQALREAHETLETCIEQRTRELSDAVGELEAFNRRVAHDLRGPLYGISGLSSLIQGRLARPDVEQRDVEQVQAWLGMVETQSRRLAEMVGGLLNLSQIARGALDVQASPLAGLAAEALQTVAMVHGARAQAAVDIGPLPQARVDPVLIRQVFVNLIGNAMKFTRGIAQPRVEVRCEREGTHWKIRVSDNGVGFPAGREQMLFQPFARLHDNTYEGSGIGLTVVQRIVQQHGGDVGAEGAEGRGATFFFTLPA
ncbi:ATP-binding protein [Aquincola sp. MAHUQ-54]|uniref:histidine kinase n=1 Tax=Aquincola agrisoli TaxID=3119538 RepID=A0AAW9Q7L2_9BURK